MFILGLPNLSAYHVDVIRQYVLLLTVNDVAIPAATITLPKCNQHAAISTYAGF